MGNTLGVFQSVTPLTNAVDANAEGAESNAIAAVSTRGNGIIGQSLLAGVHRVDFSVTPGGSGVVGKSDQGFGFGVTGIATGERGTGVQAVATGDATALVATASSGNAVVASSNSGNALIASSSGAFNAPQVTVSQGTQNDFARIRIGNIENPPQPWDIAAGGPDGVFNIYSIQSETNVLSAASNEDVTVSGSLKQHSSRELKEGISDLSTREALCAIEHLKPVQYQLHNDKTQSRHLGFLAEDMPDLLASPKRDTISHMDIIAVLTGVIRHLCSENTELSMRVERLEKQ